MGASSRFDRRKVLAGGLACAGCHLLSAVAPGLFLLAPRPARAQDPMGGLTFEAEQEFQPVEARYYRKLSDKAVACELCPQHCQVPEGGRGLCGARENRGGVYTSLVYGRVVAANTDPIEKKPFFHYRPGTTAFSIATAGCNLRCQYCQNWQISQYRPEQVRAMRMPPSKAHEFALASGAPTIAYTYNEPTIWHEFMHDTAALKDKTGVRSVVVSNGMIEPEPLKALLQHVDAIRYDLKSFRQEYYARVCGGQLKAVLRSIEAVRASGRWLELIVLVVPTMNDSEAEVRDLARWVKTTLGPDVPVHFTRFHPDYRLRNLPPTPVSTLERCLAIARAEGLNFAYPGNVAGHPAESTFCPGCNTRVIKRAGLTVQENRLVNGACPECKRGIPGVWA